MAYSGMGETATPIGEIRNALDGAKRDAEQHASARYGGLYADQTFEWIQINSSLWRMQATPRGDYEVRNLTVYRNPEPERNEPPQRRLR